MLITIEAMAGLGCFKANLMETARGLYLLQGVSGTPRLLMLEAQKWFPQYDLEEIAEQVKAWRGDGSGGDLKVLTTVTVPSDDVTAATTNLLGPVVVDLVACRGRQFVLHQSDYPLQQPVFPKGGWHIAGSQPQTRGIGADR